MEYNVETSVILTQDPLVALHTANVNEQSHKVRISGGRDSNPQPTAWKAVTLPLSYPRTAYYIALSLKVNIVIRKFTLRYAVDKK
jgi:hypothetical protein